MPQLIQTNKKKRIWERTAKVRRKILIGATMAFSQRGYYGTSLVEISKKTRAEQASIYYHFYSKEKLFQKCLIYTHLIVIRDLKKSVVTDLGLRSELISIFNGLAHYADIYPERISMIFQLVYSAPKEISAMYTRKYGGHFRSLIERAFVRNPPRAERTIKQSLVVDMFYSFILSLSAPAVRNDRRLMVPKGIDFILGDTGLG